MLSCSLVIFFIFLAELRELVVFPNKGLVRTDGPMFNKKKEKNKIIKHVAEFATATLKKLIVYSILGEN